MTTFLITTFCISLAGIMAMLGWKMRLLSLGEHHVVVSVPQHHNFSMRAFGWYRMAQRLLRALMLAINAWLLRVIAILLRALIRGLMVLNQRVQKRLSSLTNMVRGKVQTPLTPENASPFLKDITKHKDEVRGGGSME
ncbi:MAG: hypothetical protein A2675_00570 [Candidatus Yonathbacteria bacterium RIFCSPHIGHO2_01_FULL_51_10]|uniref:Uncharacterized protein n=1 Tax=Candidatus Yonathbacteria bacterium RIFCSPHIGHO2_01_FULL_51_10 TaxID=1802723 RepID=A0A1G2S6E0_9BACT|nr:MAG: hypothetical protein A2675_00570 [Candidatus Yonathbacteria bacterium RIFCSPHIGHO2_01_FULL_51_10]